MSDEQTAVIDGESMIDSRAIALTAAVIVCSGFEVLLTV